MREMTTSLLHAKRMLVAIDDGAAQSERSAKLLKTGASAATAFAATSATADTDALAMHGFLQQLDVRDAQLDFPLDSHDHAHGDADAHGDAPDDTDGGAASDYACGEKCSNRDQVESQFEPEPEPELQLESQQAAKASPQARDGHDKNEMEANHPALPLDVSAETGEPNSVDPELEAAGIAIASADRMPYQSWESTLKTTSSFAALLFDEPATHGCGSCSDPCQISVDDSASMLTYLDALLASDDEDLGVDVNVDADGIDVTVDEIDVNVDAIGHDYVSKQQPLPSSGYEKSPIFAQSDTPRPKDHVSVDTATAVTPAAVACTRDREILTASTMANIPEEIFLRLEVATHFIFAIVDKLGLDTSPATTTTTTTSTINNSTALSTRTAEFAVDWFVHIMSSGVRFTSRDEEDGLAMAVLLTAIRQADGFKTPLELALASGVAESQILTSLLVLVTVPPMKTENKSVDGYARRMCELLDLPVGTADVVARGARLARVLLDVAEERAPLVVAAVAFWVAFGFGTPDLERSVEQVRVALSRADGPANYSHLKRVIDKIDSGRASIFPIVMTRP